MHLLALFLLAAPPAAAAPPPPDFFPTAAGTTAVSFGVATGGDTHVGATYFMAPDMGVRLDFGLNASLLPSGPTQQILFDLGVGLRFYKLKRNHVAVFIQPFGALGHELSPAVSGETAWYLRVGGGVGVEYFFTDHFSAGATLNLDLKLANLAGPTGTKIFLNATTATSALEVSLFF